MATAKQVQLLATLAIKAGKIKPADAPAAMAGWMSLPSKDVSATIDRLNDALGFDKKFNPATSTQRGFILDLERKVLGKVETTHDVKMTYAEADSRIKYLRAIQAQKKPVTTATSNVIDIFSKKAV